LKKYQTLKLHSFTPCFQTTGKNLKIYGIIFQAVNTQLTGGILSFGRLTGRQASFCPDNGSKGGWQ
jgi:hypothetical protein